MTLVRGGGGFLLPCSLVRCVITYLFPLCIFRCAYWGEGGRWGVGGVDQG